MSGGVIAIVANGETPSGRAREILASARVVVACDGALSRARACGREPNFVVGDGDSIPLQDRAALAGRFVHVAEQDTNDLAKAFRFARTACPDAESVVVVGAGGGREDHLIGNVFRLVGFADEFPEVSMATNAGLFVVVPARREFACRPGEAVSVFASRPGLRAVSEGLEWPLDGVDLSSPASGTLNRTTGTSFTVAADGPLVVYRPWPRKESAPMRVGFGYDSHRFDESRALRLGGVDVPDAPGLAAHSDGDALIHAVIDALLGAAALGDIGSHFPDSDPKWKDADSAELLKAVVAEIALAGWRVGNVDATVICERPKLLPHVPAIRARLASLLGVEVGRVSVKGKTNERMDDVGRGVGLEVHCVATLES